MDLSDELAFAVVHLGLSPSEFEELTPREFSTLIAAHHAKEYMEWMKFASISHVVYTMNSVKGSKRMKPGDFVLIQKPKEKEKTIEDLYAEAAAAREGILKVFGKVSK